MGRFTAWLKDHLPTRRRLIQLYAAVLYNAHVRGFISGSIYTGGGKALCVPGLNCYSCPGAVGACPLGSLQNAIASSQSRAPVYVIGILMVCALTLGRTVCGFLCPIGLLQELAYKIPTPKVKKGRVTRALSWLKYIILAVFVLIVPLWYALQSYPLPAFCKYICPAGTLQGAVGILSNPANAETFGMLGGLFTWKFLILLAISAACVFVFRAFCRFLCPLGAIYGSFARIALIGVKLEQSECTDCGKCTGICKMDIRRVGDHECIHCGDCIDACPTGAISFKAGKVTLRAPRVISDAVPAPKKRRALRAAAGCLAVILLAAVLWAVNRDVETPKPDIPVGMEVGMLAPDFTVEVYGGDPFTLSEQEGRITVVNFWATWCGPCCAELPHFDSIAKTYGDQVSVIAVHSNLVTDDVQAYLDEYDYGIPFGLDQTGSVIASFGGSTMLPMTVIVDDDGVITYNAVGSLTYERIEALLIEAGLEG